MRGDVVGRLSLLGGVEFDVFLGIEVGILVEESGTEFYAQHILHGALQHLGLHHPLVDGFLQILVVGTVREVHIVAAIDGSHSLLKRRREIRYLVDGRIVAHHHPVETYIAAQDILQDLAVGHTPDAVHVMIAWHDGHTARQTDHRLVGQQDLFHQFLLFGITAAAVAQVVLRTGPHALLHVVLLQTLHEGCSHDSRQVAVFAIRLFETVEAGCATDIDHRRQCQDATHLAQGGARLIRLQLCQLGVE